MSQLPKWLPDLLERINSACATSPLLANLDQDELAVATGKTICLDLWPFIKDLPTNISTVRDALPPGAGAARNLLDKLADDERHYQLLFLKQCELAGLSDKDLLSYEPSGASRALCSAIEKFTRQASLADGIYAVVTAELAATAFCRAALPHYERYFARFKDNYAAERVEEGLAWLRLHAKPHMRHALWLTRMLADIDGDSSAQAPQAVEMVLEAVSAFLGCPPGQPGQRQATDLAKV